MTYCHFKDEGIGIETQFQEKIFKIFERYSPEIEGTGLGMAIVKRIIESHQGKVWVYSEGIGTGSTFSFSLPNGKTTNATAMVFDQQPVKSKSKMV